MRTLAPRLTRIALAGVLSAGLIVAGLGGASVAAGSDTCSLSAGTLTVTLDPFHGDTGLGTGRTELGGDSTGKIVVTEDDRPIDCGGAPLASLTAIELQGSEPHLQIDDPESFVNGSGADIPITDAAGGLLVLRGTSGNQDWLAASVGSDGAAGVDLDPGAADGNEINITGRTNLEMAGNSGRDHLSAAGGGAPPFPYRVSLVSGRQAPSQCFKQFCGGSGTDSAGDLLEAGAGNSQLIGGLQADTLVGGASSDHLDGAEGKDLLLGNGGNDFLFGASGQDRAYGGGGDDVISGGVAADLIAGGAGRDLVDYSYETSGVHVSLNGRRNDGGPIDGLHSGRGGDTLRRVENINGSFGPDVLSGGPGANLIVGFEGNDRIFGAPGNDRLFGGTGRDRVYGGTGRDLCGGRGDVKRGCEVLTAALGP